MTFIQWLLQNISEIYPASQVQKIRRFLTENVEAENIDAMLIEQGVFSPQKLSQLRTLYYSQQSRSNEKSAGSIATINISGEIAVSGNATSGEECVQNNKIDRSIATIDLQSKNVATQENAPNSKNTAQVVENQQKMVEIQSIVRDANNHNESNTDITLNKDLEQETVHYTVSDKWRLGNTDEEVDSKNPKKIGHNRIIRVLGEGSFGKVYLVFNEVLQVEQALKVLFHGHQDRDEYVQRFFREARAIAKLRHPNISSAYDIGEEQGTLYYTMDYVKGKSLDEVLKEKTRLEPYVAAEYMYKCARALHYAHQHNIIHRDIKPENIMICEETNEPIVMDFGLARQIGGSEISKTGDISGTPSYMSPEQTIGRNSKLDHRTDIYSLGATLYKLMTGQSPFRGSSTIEVLQKVNTDNLVPPRQLDASIPEELEKICLKAMSKDRDKRFADAESLARELKRFMRSLKYSQSDGEYSSPVTPENQSPRITSRVQRSRQASTSKQGERWRNFSLGISVFFIIVILVLISRDNSSALTITSQSLAKENGRLENLFDTQSKLNEQLKKENTELVKENNTLKIKHEDLRQQVANLQKKLHEQAYIQQKSFENNISVEQNKEYSARKDIYSLYRGNLKRSGVYAGKAFPDSVYAKWSVKVAPITTSSPIVHNNVVYLGQQDQHFYAIDANTGKTLWRYRVGHLIESPACVYKNLVIFGAFDKYVYILHAKNGNLLRKIETGGMVIASPCVYKDVVYFGSLDHCMYAFDLVAKKLLWKQKLPDKIHGSTAIEDDVLYTVCNTGLYAMSHHNKGKVLWKVDLDGPLKSTPAIYKKHIYVNSESGTTYCISIVDKKIVWKFTTTGRLLSSVAVFGNSVYVTSYDHHLYSLDCERGSVNWKFSSQGAISCSPIYVDGVVYFGSVDGKLYAVTSRSGKAIWSANVGSVISSPVWKNNHLYIIGGIDVRDDTRPGYLHAITKRE